MFWNQNLKIYVGQICKRKGLESVRGKKMQLLRDLALKKATTLFQ
jgi:hypothetical protein